MRKSFKTLLTAGTAILFLLLQAPALASVPIELDAQNKAQISFFKAALDELGPTNPEEAVRLWVKGDRTRDGVFKYAAADKRLKKQLIDRWGDPEKNFWIIGGSSPWLTGADIKSRDVQSPAALRYTVEYHWATSAGPEPATIEALTVTKDGENWFVSKVVPLRGFQNY